LTLQTNATTTNYSLTFPAAQGAANQTLSNNGSGALSWVSALTSSTGYINGGNSFAGNASIGLADNYNLNINTNNTARMTILNGGNVGIGTTSPGTNLEVVSTTSGIRGITTTTYSTNPGGLFQTRGARGTLGSPSPLLINDPFSWYAMSGYDGSAFSFQSLPTGMGGVATENWSSTAHGSAVRFISTPNGTTNGVEAMRVDQNGNVGIGSTSPRSSLDVNGTLLLKASTLNVTTTIDFSTGNFQHTAADCGAFQLNNLKDGGSYTFVVKGTNVATCSFTAFSGVGTGALTYHLPPDHGATVTGKHTVYSIIVVGSDVYSSWVPGL